MGDIKRVSVLWRPFDQHFHANMKTKALLAGLGDDTGRVLQLTAVQRVIEGHIRFVDPAIGAESIDKISDVVVIIGGTPALAESLGVGADLLKKIKTPLMAIDLAVGELDKPALGWLTALGKKTPIWVNSESEKQKLEAAGFEAVSKGSSLTQFMNPSPDLGERILANWQRREALEAICVVQGQGKRTRPAERDLVKLAFEGPILGGYIAQHGLGALQLARGEFGPVTKADINTLRSRSMPELGDAAFRRFCRNSLSTHFSTSSWMEALRRYDLVVGGSFQGVALALQTQRMGLAVVDNDAFEGACAEAGLPYIRAHDVEPMLSLQSLKSLIQFSAKRYLSIRQHAATNFSAFLSSAGLEVRPPVKQLLKN